MDLQYDRHYMCKLGNAQLHDNGLLGHMRLRTGLDSVGLCTLVVVGIQH